MIRLKIKLLTCLVLFTGQAVYSQILKVGFASSKESSFSNTVVQIDSVFEQTEKGDYYLMPLVDCSCRILFKSSIQ